MAEITLKHQIDCVNREIAMRQNVYPGLVRRYKMTQTNSDWEIAVMRSILAKLEAERDADPGA